MFCKNCGARNPDNAALCEDCGSPLRVAERESEGSGVAKIWIFGLVGIAVILASVFLLEYLKTRPIGQHLHGYATATASEYLGAFPDDYTEDINESRVESKLEIRERALKEHFGKNVKITCRTLDKVKLKGDDLEEIAKELDRYYNMDEDKVTAAYRVMSKITTKGSKETQINYAEYIVIKYDGKWYLHPKHY